TGTSVLLVPTFVRRQRRISYESGPRHAFKPPEKGSANPSIAHGHPPRSFISSARASSVCGTLRPSALAVLRLITSSNLVVRGHSGPTQKHRTSLGCAGSAAHRFLRLLESSHRLLG